MCVVHSTRLISTILTCQRRVIIRSMATRVFALELWRIYSLICAKIKTGAVAQYCRAAYDATIKIINKNILNRALTTSLCCCGSALRWYDLFRQVISLTCLSQLWRFIYHVYKTLIWYLAFWIITTTLLRLASILSSCRYREYFLTRAPRSSAWYNSFVLVAGSIQKQICHGTILTKIRPLPLRNIMYCLLMLFFSR